MDGTLLALQGHGDCHDRHRRHRDAEQPIREPTPLSSCPFPAASRVVFGATLRGPRQEPERVSAGWPRLKQLFLVNKNGLTNGMLCCHKRTLVSESSEGISVTKALMYLQEQMKRLILLFSLIAAANAQVRTIDEFWPLH